MSRGEGVLRTFYGSTLVSIGVLRFYMGDVCNVSLFLYIRGWGEWIKSCWYFGSFENVRIFAGD